MPTNDNNYNNCHITAIEVFNQSYGVYIMPLVINSLRGRHTNTHILMFTDKGNSKKPGSHLVEIVL